MSPTELPEAITTSTDDDDARYCHLAEVERPGVAVCGSTVRHHPGESPIAFEGDEKTCPVCQRPVCPACRQIFAVANRSGAWEGP